MGEAEQAIPMPNNEQRLKVNYYLAWARTYLKRGGAVENSARGVWAITEAGTGMTKRAAVVEIEQTVRAQERDPDRHHPVEPSLEEGVDERLLVREVLVEGADADPRPLGDAGRRGSGAFAREHLSRRLDDGVDRRLRARLLRLPPPRHRTNVHGFIPVPPGTWND